MTILQLKKEIMDTLNSQYSSHAINQICNVLLEKHVGHQPYEILLNRNQIVDKNTVDHIKYDLKEILKDKPYQYQIGYTWFFDLKIMVNPSVLIPRPETEELVHWIVEHHTQTNKLDIIDIGTGSGCIALALKHQLSNASVTGVDISPDALQIARKNAKLNNLNVHFELFDVLNYLPDKQHALFDIVVSNPPYIPLKEKASMDKIVTNHEPDLALFTPNNNPLIFYEAICRYARQYLKPKGQLYFELHELYHNEVKEVMLKFGFQCISIQKDLQGKFRMIKAIL